MQASPAATGVHCSLPSPPPFPSSPHLSLSLSLSCGPGCFDAHPPNRAKQSSGYLLYLFIRRRLVKKMRNITVLFVNPAIMLLPYGRHIPFLNRIRFKEHPPYGIKDERLRARVAEMLFSDNVKDVGLPTTPGISLFENLELVKRVVRDLPKVKAPVLIVHATEDDITHIRNAEKIARMVSGPVRKLYLEDSYHLVTVDRERVKVALATVKFCEDLSNGVEIVDESV